MEYRGLGQTGWRVSTVSMGCWALGGNGGDQRGGRNRDGPARLRLRDEPVRHCDAYGLGRSEAVLGLALQGIRDKVYVASKAGNFARRIGAPLSFTTPQHVYLCCDASLHRDGITVRAPLKSQYPS